jgi:type IV fimbrial biogenesis protein FimT
VLINRITARGVTIIEMMIAITIISILLMLALPSMSTWLNNAQIRTAGETLLNGITLARSEALHRNTTVRFQLTTTLDSSCARSATGTSWVVSLADPTGACDTAPSDTTAPQIIQKKSGSEGSPRAQITANGGTNTIYFNGLGRPVNPGGVATITQIDITNPTAGVCQNVDPANGPMRCLRITISTGGESKMCDPAVTDNTDPRFC